MNQASKLSVAMELIEKQIAEISKKMHNSEEIKFIKIMKMK